MMEFGRDTDPSEHRIYILWCQKPKHPRFGLYFQRSHKSAQLHNRSIINVAIVISGGLTLESKCSIPLQESVIKNLTPQNIYSMF